MISSLQNEKKAVFHKKPVELYTIYKDHPNEICLNCFFRIYNDPNIGCRQMFKNRLKIPKNSEISNSPKIMKICSIWIKFSEITQNHSIFAWKKFHANLRISLPQLSDFAWFLQTMALNAGKTEFVIFRSPWKRLDCFPPRLKLASKIF